MVAEDDEQTSGGARAREGGVHRGRAAPSHRGGRQRRALKVVTQASMSWSGRLFRSAALGRKPGSGSEDHAMEQARGPEEQVHGALQADHPVGSPDLIGSRRDSSSRAAGLTACGVSGSSATIGAAGAYSGVSMAAVEVVVVSMVGAAGGERRRGCEDWIRIERGRRRRDMG
jgi:hypothetical protein